VRLFLSIIVLIWTSLALLGIALQAFFLGSWGWGYVMVGIIICVVILVAPYFYNTGAEEFKQWKKEEERIKPKNVMRKLSSYFLNLILFLELCVFIWGTIMNSYIFRFPRERGIEEILAYYGRFFIGINVFIGGVIFSYRIVKKINFSNWWNKFYEIKLVLLIIIIFKASSILYWIFKQVLNLQV